MADSPRPDAKPPPPRQLQGLDLEIVTALSRPCIPENRGRPLLTPLPSNELIAQELGFSVETVRTHLTQLYSWYVPASVLEEGRELERTKLALERTKAALQQDRKALDGNLEVREDDAFKRIEVDLRRNSEELQRNKALGHNWERNKRILLVQAVYEKGLIAGWGPVGASPTDARGGDAQASGDGPAPNSREVQAGGSTRGAPAPAAKSAVHGTPDERRSRRLPVLALILAAVAVAVVMILATRASDPTQPQPGLGGHSRGPRTARRARAHRGGPIRIDGMSAAAEVR